MIGPLIAARVADYDVLVIGEWPYIGFLGRQHLPTELGRYTELLGLRIP
jgi:hypothetical protein